LSDDDRVIATKAEGSPRRYPGLIFDVAGLVASVESDLTGDGQQTPSVRKSSASNLSSLERSRFGLNRSSL
jgi:hypothetical protein